MLPEPLSNYRPELKSSKLLKITSVYSMTDSPAFVVPL